MGSATSWFFVVAREERSKREIGISELFSFQKWPFRDAHLFLKNALLKLLCRSRPVIVPTRRSGQTSCTSTRLDNVELLFLGGPTMLDRHSFLVAT